ncbi:MAG: hypothetical protein V1816_22065 [Pseudomonadota bacterium]
MKSKTALYFPLTNMSPAPLAGAMRFFETIILYRLLLDQPAPHLSRAIEAGRIKTNAVSFINDRKEIGLIIDQFAQAAAYYRDPDLIAHLMRLEAERNDEDSSSRLMTSIRGRGRGVPRDQRREAEIFLHLEGVLERQNSEVNDILSAAREKESHLGELLGVETDSTDLDDLAEDLSLPHDPALVAEPPSPQKAAARLAAWARFYEAFGPDDVPLLTDAPEIISALDLNLAKLHGPQKLPTGKNEILEPFVELRLPLDPADAADRDPSPSPAGWSDFLAKVGSRPWPVEDIPALRAEGAALAESLARPLVGPAVVATGYLLPGADLATAFLAAAGLRAKQDPRFFSGPLLGLSLL